MVRRPLRHWLSIKHFLLVRLVGPVGRLPWSKAVPSLNGPRLDCLRAYHTYDRSQEATAPYETAPSLLLRLGGGTSALASGERPQFRRWLWPQRRIMLSWRYPIWYSLPVPTYLLEMWTNRWTWVVNIPDWKLRLKQSSIPWQLLWCCGSGCV